MFQDAADAVDVVEGNPLPLPDLIQVTKYFPKIFSQNIFPKYLPDLIQVRKNFPSYFHQVVGGDFSPVSVFILFFHFPHCTAASFHLSQSFISVEFLSLVFPQDLDSSYFFQPVLDKKELSSKSNVRYCIKATICSQLPNKELDLTHSSHCISAP